MQPCNCLRYDTREANDDWEQVLIVKGLVNVKI